MKERNDLQEALRQEQNKTEELAGLHDKQARDIAELQAQLTTSKQGLFGSRHEAAKQKEMASLRAQVEATTDVAETKELVASELAEAESMADGPQKEVSRMSTRISTIILSLLLVMTIIPTLVGRG